MKECSSCYDPGTTVVCLCIRVGHIFKEGNKTIEMLMQSPIFTFGLGFAMGIWLCILLSSFMRSWYEEKRKNDG